MKRIVWLAAFAMMLGAGNTQADLVITGVYDGGLTGGNPKAVVLTATADIADLSTWGAGSANNGGGTDGVELAFTGSITAGQQIIITNSQDSEDFFANCFTDNFVFFQGAPAFINGDDAIELFNNVGTTDDLFDVYGDPDVNGDGEVWDYSDGFAVRTDNTVDGTFVSSRYTYSGINVTDGLDENGTKAQLATAFGFTPVAIPEPASALFLGFGSLALIASRRRK